VHFKYALKIIAYHRQNFCNSRGKIIKTSYQKRTKNRLFQGFKHMISQDGRGSISMFPLLGAHHCCSAVTVSTANVISCESHH